ncbi:MAG: hypothetical protein K2N87_05135 [Eubacterium sp.]|nr:hypothetical protein [Eubacterium sp.]
MATVWKLQKRANGPVCPELFHMHQGKFYVCMDDFARGYPDALTEDEKDSVNIVLHDYGNMKPYDLRGLSHSEVPWKDVRGDLPAWTRRRTVITKNKMREYYGSL